MRNLHLEGIRTNSEFFINLIRSLGINVCPNTHERELRRFILGRRMIPYIVTKGEKQDVTTIQADFDSCTLDDFFNGYREIVSIELSEKNINIDKIQNICFSTDENGYPNVEIVFSRAETDAEFLSRKSKADIFNEILENKDFIYKSIDKIK